MSESSWQPEWDEDEPPGSGVPREERGSAAPQQEHRRHHESLWREPDRPGPEAGQGPRSELRPTSGSAAPHHPHPSHRPWAAAPAPAPWQSRTAAAHMLASHADRERAVDVLRAGYGEGRMEKGEFDDRVERVYAARTVGELALLVADLPHGPVPQPGLAAVPGTFLPLPPRPRTNGKAVGAAVCGLLCVPTMGFAGLPAVILGHAARAEIQRTGERGDGLALTGLVFGWLSTAFWAAVLAVLIVVGITSG